MHRLKRILHSSQSEDLTGTHILIYALQCHLVSTKTTLSPNTEQVDLTASTNLAKKLAQQTPIDNYLGDAADGFRKSHLILPAVSLASSSNSSIISTSSIVSRSPATTLSPHASTSPISSEWMPNDEKSYPISITVAMAGEGRGTSSAPPALITNEVPEEDHGIELNAPSLINTLNLDNTSSQNLQSLQPQQRAAQINFEKFH